MKAEGRRQKAKSQKLNSQIFQQGGPEYYRISISLLTKTRIISIFCGLILFLVACCPPATNSSLKETAFTATILGFSNDGQYVLARAEPTKTDVQLYYSTTANLVVGQQVYVVGRLEGKVVRVSDLRPL